jgi:hypothetical protein
MKTMRVILTTVALGVIFAGGLWLGFSIRRWTGDGDGPTAYETATVLRQVQTLSQLVTVKYVLEKVVVLEDVKWFGDNRVLLVAHGVVKAGVDLGRMKPEDVQVTGKQVTLRLPSPRITDAYLDDRQTRVVERTTGLLRSFDKDLEQTAREFAVDDLRRGARNAGIMKDAEERANAQVQNMFAQMGLTVEFVSP